MMPSGPFVKTRAEQDYTCKGCQKPIKKGRSLETHSTSIVVAGKKLESTDHYHPACFDDVLVANALSCGTHAP